MKKPPKTPEKSYLGYEIDFHRGGTRTDNSLTKLSSFWEKFNKNYNNPYIGNKKKLIKFLVDTIIEKYNIQYDSFLDLFSGSSYVSMAIKKIHKKVITNDLLTSSYFNAIAYIKNKDISLSQEDIKDLFTFPKEEPPHFINEKYLNRFSKREINIIESYFERIDKLWGNPLKEDMKAVLATVFMQNYIMDCCFVGGRLNNGQILAKYEHRVKHQRNRGLEMFNNDTDKNGISYKDMKFLEPLYPQDKNIHECYNMDAIDFLTTIHPIVDLCYIDPPYGGDQSDYGYMYSFLEELIYRESYEDIKKNRDGDSRFTSGKKYRDNFDELMGKVSYIPNLIISYNSSSWGTIEEICDVIKKYRSNIVVEEFLYSYKYRNKSKEDKAKEYVIVVKE